MAWIGRKRLALIPVHRSNARIADDPVPANWESDILRRILFDPDTITNPLGFSKADRSLRAYIHAASSGRADLDTAVMPMRIVDLPVPGGMNFDDVPVDFLDGQLGSDLRNEGFDAAAIVMLGGPGAGTNSGFWSRFVMRELVGTWAMEFMHSLTGFADLYPFQGNMGAFDEMACSCGTHPSAYTKGAIGWLDASAIAQHIGRTVNYDLHSVGLVQPPPAGKVAAVQIGTVAPYLMVEARQKVDQFDSNIPSEGVIAYRVQTSNPLGWAQNNTAPIELLTATALTSGMSFTSDTGVTVQVINALPGGFSVSINDPTHTIVPDVFEESPARAHQLVLNAGLVPVFTGTNTTHAWVASQSPVAGIVAAVGDTVTMFLRTGPRL